MENNGFLPFKLILFQNLLKMRGSWWINNIKFFIVIEEKDLFLGNIGNNYYIKNKKKKTIEKLMFI